MQSVALSGCGEFVEKQLEAEYRADHLPEFIHQAWLVFCYSVIINFLFFFSDWRFHGQRHFFFAISSRAAIEITSLIGLVAIKRVRSSRSFELSCIAWSCFVIPAGAILVSTHTDIALLVTFILPVLFYLAIPTSFRWTAALGLACSAAALSAYMLPCHWTGTSLGLICGMAMSNAVLVLVLIQSQRLRRLEWAASRAERATNEELSAHRNFLHKLLKAVPVPLIITAREDGRLLQANDIAGAYFGAALYARSFQLQNYIDQRDCAELLRRVQSNEEIPEFETRLHLPRGRVVDVLLAVTDVTAAGTEALLTVFVDITHRKEVEATMEKLATTDPLSGLPNRARFFAIAADEIKRAQRYKRPLAVFMVDIDLFKRINDTHGHEAGDRTLKAFAELCRRWIRSQDLVARLGGEEFAFLLPETPAATALALADRLRASVAHLRMKRIPAPITISVGVSEVLPGETTVDAALARADYALYAAKRSGRNQAVLYESAEMEETHPAD
jgi:diguanylate cyclase (GGDEF)-like protein